MLGTGVEIHGGETNVMPADGNQTSPHSNRLVTITFTGADRTNVTGLRFNSPTSDAFEFDNVTVNAVPEPASRGLMILGFGMVGASLRRRSMTLAHAV